MTKLTSPSYFPASTPCLTAEELMLNLPEKIRPVKTAKEYPHLMGKFAELWSTPATVIPFFDNLLIDNRGGRNGFTPDVLFEIQALKEHYQEKNAPGSSRANVWSQAIDLEQKASRSA